MFEVDFKNGEWVNPHIKPYGNLSLSPALSCMHYGQAIFEGMKAIKTDDGEITLFRPFDNWERLNFSARRLKMPEIPKGLFMDAMELWLKLDEQWIPNVGGASLYIRPLMIATDDYLGVKASESYKFLMYGCPVSSYYSEPLRLRIEEQYVRAVRGGVGEAKAAGNYAASMYPASLAQAEGFHQLLWTDAIEHKYIEELGTSNFFAVIDNKLFTPATNGTILKGITRDSVIKLAESMGVEVIQAPLEKGFLLSKYQEGNFKEAFATGTAATIAPIKLIRFGDVDMELTVDEHSLSSSLHRSLDALKYGKTEDQFGWIYSISHGVSFESN